MIYIHLSLYNNSNISFEVEDLHFRIEDRKAAKRTAQQQTPLELLRVCNDLRIVRAHQRQRTVFALPKFTMPDDKILVLEIVERNGARHQLSRFATSRSGWHGPFDPQRIAPSGTIISAGELLYY